MPKRARHDISDNTIEEASPAMKVSRTDAVDYSILPEDIRLVIQPVFAHDNP